MDRFAELLRFYRERCHDKERGKGKLTQARLSELIEAQSGLIFTSQAISYWEQGKSQINKDDRSLLDALIKIFVEHGGMTSPTEANTFLLAGNYRPLSPNEMQKIFPVFGDSVVVTETPPISSAPTSFRGYFVLFISFLGELVFRPSSKVEPLLEEGSESPVRWHTIFMRMFGRLRDAFGKYLPALFPWVICWWLTWQFAFSLMDLPFANQMDALQKVVLYVGGAIIVPALIALFTKTKDDPFWQQEKLAQSPNLRLYTYQAAYLGFFIGYAFVLAFALFGYYIGIQTIHPIFSGIAALIPIIISYATARQIPFDRWRAYGDLSLQRDKIFFVFAFYPFYLGFLFLFWHPYLLHRFWGPGLILTSIIVIYYLNKYHKPNAFIQLCLILMGIVSVLSAIVVSQILLAFCIAAFYILLFIYIGKEQKKVMLLSYLATVLFLNLGWLFQPQLWLLPYFLLLLFSLLWKWDKPTLLQMNNFFYLWFIILVSFFLTKKAVLPELGSIILFTALFLPILYPKSKIQV